MLIEPNTFARALETRCDAEPIHLAGSIQPHGVLLVFSPADEQLIQWAGDSERFLGRSLAAGVVAGELLDKTLGTLLEGTILEPDCEPLHAGYLHLPGCEPASVSVHTATHAVIVELEPASESISGADLLERVRKISEQLAAMATLQGACDAAAGEVGAISGFDRVMIYQFNEDKSGTVIAEAVANSADSYLGHRFPAGDIPSQARELYRRNLLRVIEDVDYRPVGLEPPDAGSPLDMSNCILRSVSPIHLQYLKNMGVGASMSVSVIVEGELWGLIACHHAAARSVSVETRLLCRHVGATLAAFIRSNKVAQAAAERESHRSALEDALGVLRSSEDSEGALRSSASQLLSLIDCGGVALMAGSVPVATAGRVPREQGLATLAAIAAAELEATDLYSTDRLAKGHPRAAGLRAEASGLIAIQVQAWEPLMVLWLGPEQVETISWAGNPNLKALAGGAAGPLTPRHSFATWEQTVRGCSRRWRAEEVRTVELFRTRTDFILQRQRLERVRATLEDANKRLSALATTDPLTGLANRRLFDERLQSEWKRSLRQGSPLGLVALDVDNFKKYNDRFGHPAGDVCLARIALALDEARRSGDLAARVGGEEFALLLPETDADAALLVAERLRRAIEAIGIDHPLNPGGIVTASLGVAAGHPAGWSDSAAFVKSADEALYKAKQAGRNRVGRGMLEPAG